MPLIKIESRSKEKQTGATSRSRGSRSGSASSSGGGSGAGMAIAAGALIGVMVIAGIAAFMLARSNARENVAELGGPLPGEASSGAPAADSGAAIDPAAPLPVPTPMLDPINSDYARDHVVAVVNGEPYTMGELEIAVRIAQVLGALSGDAVPAYDSPDMPAFEVRMLRRQIDMILMLQAAQAAGLASPPENPDEMIDAFLFRIGSNRGRLEQLMTAHGVTQEQLEAWFNDSSELNSFVQQQLMPGEDQELRNEITQAWLSEQWDTQDIRIDFYDPDTLSIEQDPLLDQSSTSGDQDAATGGAAPDEGADGGAQGADEGYDGSPGSGDTAEDAAGAADGSGEEPGGSAEGGSGAAQP